MTAVYLDDLSAGLPADVRIVVSTYGETSVEHLALYVADDVAVVMTQHGDLVGWGIDVEGLDRHTRLALDAAYDRWLYARGELPVPEGYDVEDDGVAWTLVDKARPKDHPMAPAARVFHRSRVTPMDVFIAEGHDTHAVQRWVDAMVNVQRGLAAERAAAKRAAVERALSPDRLNMADVVAVLNDPEGHGVEMVKVPAADAAVEG